VTHFSINPLHKPGYPEIRVALVTSCLHARTVFKFAISDPAKPTGQWSLLRSRTLVEECPTKDGPESPDHPQLGLATGARKEEKRREEDFSPSMR